ncbi:hypothetical protein [Pontibacter beigongshangensis]|uniref:hypothetical protein n=1 Tax=Pontibacter beigongshangensis TaxID=2574733 RepID=UPI00164F2D6F|nr:hypothetical protein [Pontibacter beigongshangensis]
MSEAKIMPAIWERGKIAFVLEPEAQQVLPEANYANEKAPPEVLLPPAAFLKDPRHRTFSV